MTFGEPCPVSDLFGAAGRELLDHLEIPQPWRGTVDASIALIDDLESEIDAIERELRSSGAEHRYVPSRRRRLPTFPITRTKSSARSYPRRGTSTARPSLRRPSVSTVPRVASRGRSASRSSRILRTDRGAGACDEPPTARPLRKPRSARVAPAFLTEQQRGCSQANAVAASTTRGPGCGWSPKQSLRSPGPSSESTRQALGVARPPMQPRRPPGAGCWFTPQGSRPRAGSFARRAVMSIDSDRRRVAGCQGPPFAR